MLQRLFLSRSSLVRATAILVLVYPLLLPAQQRSGGGRATAPSISRTPAPSTAPSTPEQEPQSRLEIKGPVYVSGRVLLPDGSPPPQAATIELTCSQTALRLPEGYTDSRGYFNIRLGDMWKVIPDASVNTVNITGTGRSSTRALRQPGSMGSSGYFSERELAGCEIKAVLPGYQSQAVQLAGRRLVDNPDVGILILKPLRRATGSTVNIHALSIPKEAERDYEKGVEALRKTKWKDAQKQFEKAVKEYPQYAAAWAGLAQALINQGKFDQAEEVIGKALSLDSREPQALLQACALYSKKARLAKGHLLCQSPPRSACR